MSDYIDREAVMRQFATRVRRSNNSDFAQTPTWNQAVQIVEDYPAADVAPVRHGRWVYNDGDNIPYCSECEMPQDTECNYCPSCGAKMDGEESDGKELMRQAADAIEELADRNVGKWIPVTERLPSKNGFYLCLYKHKHPGGVAIDEGLSIQQWYNGRWNLNEIYTVTHWMPLPEPPKEES